MMVNALPLHYRQRMDLGPLFPHTLLHQKIEHGGNYSCGGIVRPFKTAIRTALAVFAMTAIPVTGWGFCFEEAGREYGIRPKSSTTSPQSSRTSTGCDRENKNGSYDYG